MEINQLPKTISIVLNQDRFFPCILAMGYKYQSVGAYHQTSREHCIPPTDTCNLLLLTYYSLYYLRNAWHPQNSHVHPSSQTGGSFITFTFFTQTWSSACSPEDPKDIVSRLSSWSVFFFWLIKLCQRLPWPSRARVDTSSIRNRCLGALLQLWRVPRRKWVLLSSHGSRGN